MGQILTTKELAEYLKLTEVTIYKYVNEGKLPGFKVGSRWRFDKSRIDELLRQDRDRSSNSSEVEYGKASVSPQPPHLVPEPSREKFS